MVIKGEQLQEAVNKVLQEYTEDVAKSMDEVVQEAGKECAKDVNARAVAAGIGGKKYVKSWKSKVTNKSLYGTEVTVYSTQYQVTHLLENGHTVIVHGKVCGTAPAFPHIQPAEQTAIQNLENKIKKKVQQ